MNAPCFLTFLLCIHNLLVMFFFQAMDEKNIDYLFQFQEIEHCTTEQCIYKDGEMFPCYCDTKVLQCSQ